jgi:diguanylate cyclase (GGDEF)-like protein
MPGPVWSLAALCLILAFYVLLGVVASQVGGQPTGPGRGALLVIWVAFAALLVALRGRTPGWVLHVGSDALVICIGLVSASAPTDLRSAVILVFLIPVAVYEATWFPRAQLGLHMLLLALLTFAAIWIHLGDPDWVRVWLVVVGTACVLAYFVNALVSHLSRQVTIDPVTGLTNRVGLATMADVFARRGVNGLPRTVVLIDLDDFKLVNDVRGHDAGDDVLRQVGEALREHLRPTDILTRFGGDEFVLLLARLSVAQAGPIVERLAQGLPVPASYGLADWPLTATFEEALASADRAMYSHKRSRKGT